MAKKSTETEEAPKEITPTPEPEVVVNPVPASGFGGGSAGGK